MALAFGKVPATWEEAVMSRLRDILHQIPVVSRPRSARKEADELRFKLVNAETACRRLTESLAEKAAEIVQLTDDKRRLEASLSGVREELRQVRREHALAEEAVAELRVTADGLGLAMADLERAAQRRVILPGQRPAMDDISDEKRYEDGLGDA